MNFTKELYSTPLHLSNEDKETLIGVYSNNFDLIDDFVNKSINHFKESESKIFKSHSSYLKLSKKIKHCYVRSSCNSINEFENPYFCISNISINEKQTGKSIFTIYAAIMTSICKKENIIFYVENPLTERFQKHLIKIGFQNKNKQYLENYVFSINKK